LLRPVGIPDTAAMDPCEGSDEEFTAHPMGFKLDGKIERTAAGMFGLHPGEEGFFERYPVNSLHTRGTEIFLQKASDLFMVIRSELIDDVLFQPPVP